MSSHPGSHPTSRSAATSKVTVLTLAERRREGVPISMVTAYDYPSARAAEQAGFDVLLVGDSLAMVVLGHDDTLAVTMDEMVHHAKAVRRGASTPLLVGDLPFLSYQVSVEDAVRNAGRFLQEAGMDAVKLEGGAAVTPQVRAIVAAGIPVMGHLGLTPQSANALGGFRVQGRTEEVALRLLEDARALEEAGCFALVLEGIPAPLAAAVTERIGVPTIGIGAGVDTDGQVLVYHDVLGIYDRLAPRFVRRYAELGAEAVEALEAFRVDVEQRAFPAAEHSFAMPEGVLPRVLEVFDGRGSSIPTAPWSVASDG